MILWSFGKLLFNSILLLQYCSYECFRDAEDYNRPYKLLDEDSDEQINGYIAENDTYATDCVTIDAHDLIELPLDSSSGCRCYKYSFGKCINCFDASNCIKFPRDVQMEYNTLRLSTTKISSLQVGDLGLRNWHLESFIMSESMNFTVITPGAFNNMTNLRYIGLFSNPKLTFLEINSFKGCDNLKTLKIVLCGFLKFLDITRALHPSILPELKLLKLESSWIQNITRDDFDVIADTNLHALKFSLCDIKFVDPKFIVPMHNLKVLYFGQNSVSENNYLNFINEVALSNSSLRSIDFCRFNHLPIRILKKLAKTNISRLTFSCSTEFPKIEVFPKIPNIKFINLSGVSATNITADAFKDLVNLETLIISQNKLVSIPEAILLSKLINLDISGSPNDDEAKLISRDNVYTNMKNLVYMNLSQNNIARITANSFMGLAKLQVLDLQNSRTVAADNNSFRPLKNLRYLNLKKNPFPGRIMFPDIYNGLENLKVLILTNCDIQIIQAHQNIFEKMPGLQSLSLNHNRISNLYPYLFKPLAYLEHVDISNNFLKTWDFQMFANTKLLQNLVSQENTFRTITPAMLNDLSSLQNLDLRNNKFYCTCDHFKHISILVSVRFLDLLDNHPALCLFPDNYLNTSISEYMRKINSSNVCEIDTEHKVSILIGLASTLLVIIITGIILLYFYRWHVKYWLFLAKIAMSGTGGFFKNKFTTKRSYSYDAFVSYCNEDRDFVNHLVSMLENHQPYMKLCVYERDFQIGTVVSESVLESVADSRRTLLVISDSYIRSQWCRWEVQVAENHRLFFEDENGKCVSDTLVMVKLGDISTNTIISPMLKYLMKTRIYLEWDSDVAKQGMFWRKLRRALNPSSQISKLI